jgi:hypothetical protein
MIRNNTNRNHHGAGSNRYSPYEKPTSGPFAAGDGKNKKFPVGGFERMNSFYNTGMVGGDMDLRFKTISEQEIRKLLFVFDNDMLIQTVFRMYVTTYLNGEIQFKMNGFKLSKRAERWHSKKYRDIWINVLRYKWALGFCPVAAYPNEENGIEPTIPPLERCKIRYCVDFYGRRIMKFFVSSSETSLTGGSSWIDDTELMVSHVFYDAGFEPDYTGALRSRVSCIITDSITEGRNMIELGLCNFLRSFPPTFLEHEAPKIDHSIIRSPTTLHTDMAKEAQIDTSLIETGMNDALYHAQHAMMEQLKARSVGTGTGYVETPVHPVISQIKQNMIYLPEQRRYVQVTQPVPPDHWIEFRANRAERVLSLFLIPPNMILNGSSTGGGGTTLLSGPSESFRFFENQIQILHQECQDEMRDFYNDNARHSLAYLVIMNKDKNAKFDLKDIDRESNVDVFIPGIPTEDALLRWYHNGLTDFKATCEHLARRTGMPTNLFLDHPGISVKELNGIKPEAPKSSSSSSSSKK